MTLSHRRSCSRAERSRRETGPVRALLATALLALTMGVGSGPALAAVSIDGVTLNGGLPDASGSTATVRPLAATNGHIPTWADEQRETFHQMVKDNRAARLHGDDIYQQAVAQQAALFADAALDPQAGLEARRWAALGAAMVLNTWQGGEHGRLLHAPGVERARRQLAERMVAVSQAMVKHGDPEADLGLLNAAAYFADPGTSWFNPALAARLERQQAAVLLPAGRQIRPVSVADDPSNGRRSLLTAQALERCAQAGGTCDGEDRALLEAFVTSVGASDPEVNGRATARYIERTGGLDASLDPADHERAGGSTPRARASRDRWTNAPSVRTSTASSTANANGATGGDADDLLF